MKHHITNPDGSTTVLDQRTPTQSAAAVLRLMRERCEREILALAPDYRQRNAALGLLSQEETQFVKDAINGPRARLAAIEAQLAALVDGWDELEATRAAVCDAIEAIGWEE